MSYKFTGFGFMEEFTEEVDKLLERADTARVIQAQSMSGIASMNIGGSRWELIIGD